MNKYRYSSVAAASLLAVLGCSPESGDPVGQDGTTATDGASGGAYTSTGGSASATGGAPGSGGGGAVMASGGAGSGGAATGGVGTGGAVGASGGTPGTGGESSTGGATSTGGAPGTETGSAGCGKQGTRPDPKVQQRIQVGGLNRYYLMYVPENYDPEKPLPVVFGIHGLDMNNVWAAHATSGFKLIEATNNQAILLYPQGLNADRQVQDPGPDEKWGGISSNWGGPPPSANATEMTKDLDYIDAMLDFARDNYCVDEERIFSVGFSQGGFLTNTLACERASVFKAIAPVAGWGPWASNPSCSDASAGLPVIQTQGTADTTVSPQLGESTRNFWLGRAGCQMTSSPSSFGQGCVEYQGCDADKPVVYCTHGGGHSVPGEAGARAWDFFQSLD